MAVAFSQSSIQSSQKLLNEAVKSTDFSTGVERDQIFFLLDVLSFARDQRLFGFEPVQETPMITVRRPLQCIDSFGSEQNVIYPTVSINDEDPVGLLYRIPSFSLSVPTLLAAGSVYFQLPRSLEACLRASNRLGLRICIGDRTV